MVIIKKYKIGKSGVKRNVRTKNSFGFYLYFKKIPLFCKYEKERKKSYFFE